MLFFGVGVVVGLFFGVGVGVGLQQYPVEGAFVGVRGEHSSSVRSNPEPVDRE